MRAILDRIFTAFIRQGRLSVRYPGGDLVTYAGSDGPEAGIELSTPRAMRRMITNPALAIGELYMDGEFLPLGGTIYDALDVLILNTVQGGDHPLLRANQWLRKRLRRLGQINQMARARRNVAHHYDIGDDLYRLFLDQDWQYSCAYFPPGVTSLDDAQRAKTAHIAAKLLLDRPGLRVLDIGCGWGGLALALARDHGASVTGITLSQAQLARARQRAAEAGLDGQVRFELLDYRDPALSGPFDRIVSVGMFEHVGLNHYGAFFRRVRDLLAPDGVALVHAIGRSPGPGVTNAWIAKYIFPGGHIPALSEVMPAVERSGLVATDIEILRLHYAETIRHWRRRFNANRSDAAALYDERFCRMFEFYLAASELAFRRMGQMVWQMQLTRDQRAAPLTRDYITEAERARETVG